jgi:hypothetical protein
LNPKLPVLQTIRLAWRALAFGNVKRCATSLERAIKSKLCWMTLLQRQTFGPTFASFTARKATDLQTLPGTFRPNRNKQISLRLTPTRRRFRAAKTMIIERLGRGLTITERERSLLVQLGIGSPEDAMRALAATSPAGANLAGNLFRNVGVSSVQPAANQGTATR